MIGEKIAHYSISEKLGEGGMGEVYRATDSKLGRDVALKVLPVGFADDGERMARLAREAQVLASLNHPNIAAIYGIEEDEGRRALVMELVEGETLAHRIARGTLSLEDALQLALQIAIALEVAHDKGIVHRDLKPANVIVTPEGVVKVLDFGLAKAIEGEASEQNLANSPTLSARTQMGVLMGTAAYMSPEQARGEPADRRADVWAFGIVLMEMLTGETVYQGKTVSDTLAGVLAREPKWDHLPKKTPKTVKALLERCLEKEFKQRLQSIGEARIAIARFLEEGEPEEVVAETPAQSATPARGWKRALPWGLAATLAVAALVATWLAVTGPNVEQRVVRFEIRPPAETTFYLNPLNPGPAVISPDGRSLAFSALDTDGQVRLFLRRLDQLDATPLPRTEGAQYPFWSPDSRWLAYFSDHENALKKIDSTGGPPVQLCDAGDGKGGSWSTQGVILFTPDSDQPLFQVSSAGGLPKAVTDLEADTGFNSHRHPRFLPDGKSFLYLARSNSGHDSTEIRLRSMDGGSESVLLHATTAPVITEGHLLFLRDKTLMAQAFDVKVRELMGEAVPIGENVVSDGAAAFGVLSASSTGTLVYQSGDGLLANSLQWFDRGGEALGELGESTYYEQLAISPSGNHVVVGIEEANGQQDLWIFEIERGLRTRFTFSPDDSVEYPVWSHDGESVFYSATSRGSFGIFRKALGGVGKEEVIVESDRYQYPTGVSPDGKHLVFARQVEGTGFDIWILPLDEGGEAFPFRQTEFGEGEGVFSPDGRWLAYDSNESGEWEVYVTGFPGPGRKWQISTQGAVFPIWSRDGSEILVHENDGSIVAFAVDGSGESFLVREGARIMGANIPGNYYEYGLTPDGEQLLSVVSVGTNELEPLTVVLNWAAELEER